LKVVEKRHFRPEVDAPGRADAGPRALSEEPPDGWDQRVVWTANPCQRRPFVLLLSWADPVDSWPETPKTTSRLLDG
jgi:hypothetical protein